MDLKFENADAVVADIHQLRRGYRQTANWNLPQICWHLNMAMQTSMRPGPHEPIAVDEQRKAMFARILTGGHIPQGIQAPERAVPPANAPDASIDEFIGTLGKFKTFSGPFAPHRLFGSITDSDWIKLHLIHCAHHLGHLVPNAG